MPPGCGTITHPESFKIIQFLFMDLVKIGSLLAA
jgi:hypothetical protein